MLIDLQLNVLEEDGAITIMGLRQIAESLDIEHPKLMRSEIELIRAIQAASHHYPCFEVKNTACLEETNDCRWQEKCRKLLAFWHR